MVAEDAVFVIRRVGEEGGEEAVPDAPGDEDGVCEDDEGGGGVGGAVEAVGEGSAVRGCDVGF